MRMKKITFALIASALLAASPAFAGDACCAHKSAAGKMDCSKAFSQMNLSPEQKSKLDAAQAECQKGGCAEESLEKFMQTAKGILSPEQYAQLKTECAKVKPSEKTPG
jgi:hypothetical protein